MINALSNLFSRRNPENDCEETKFKAKCWDTNGCVWNDSTNPKCKYEPSKHNEGKRLYEKTQNCNIKSKSICKGNGCVWNDLLNPRCNYDEKEEKCNYHDNITNCFDEPSEKCVWNDASDPKCRYNGENDGKLEALSAKQSNPERGPMTRSATTGSRQQTYEPVGSKQKAMVENEDCKADNVLECQKKTGCMWDEDRVPRCKYEPELKKKLEDAEKKRYDEFMARQNVVPPPGPPIYRTVADAQTAGISTVADAQTANPNYKNERCGKQKSENNCNDENDCLWNENSPPPKCKYDPVERQKQARMFNMSGQPILSTKESVMVPVQVQMVPVQEQRVPVLEPVVDEYYDPEEWQNQWIDYYNQQDEVIKGLQNEVSGYTNMVHYLNKEKNYLQTQLDLQTNQIQTFQREILNLKNSESTLKQTIKINEQKTQTIEEENENSKKKVENLENARNTVKKIKEEREEKFKKEIDYLKQELQNFKHNDNTFMKNDMVKDKKIKDLETILDAAFKKIIELKNNVNQYNNKTRRD